MRFIADLHIHSHHSIATSKQSDPEHLYQWACMKGLSLLGTGDFAHPAWSAELQEKLEPAEEGLYRLKPAYRKAIESEIPPACRAEVRFVLSVEISSIYKKLGRTRKIHNLILMPHFEAAERLRTRLEGIGNIRSDGRPILGLDSRDLLEMCLEACPDVLFIPAHIWTPHFALFGAHSGFDSFEECYESLSTHIYAVETGLSSDPPMNWRLSALDNYALVSHSDAHSPQKLAREADLFDTDCSYPSIVSALKDRDPSRFLGTLEFYPQEGKYHYDGHRNCGVCWKPSQTIAADRVCPVCGKKVTVGVLHRVELLADRPEGTHPEAARHYESLVPLPELIAEALGVSSASSTKVNNLYLRLLHALGPELSILRELPIEELRRVGGTLLSEAVRRARGGEVHVQPGYDGAYGRIRAFDEGEVSQIKGQISMFGTVERKAPEPGDGSPVRPETAPQLSFRLSKADTTPEASSLDSLLAGLNPAQREAVLAEQGPIVVVAGPGTGKTRTLTHRAAHLIAHKDTTPEQILAVTFTNKAAEEMRQRVHTLLAERFDLSGLTIGTFHRVALDLLHAYAPSDFAVLDAWEASDLLGEVAGELGLKERVKALRDAISNAKSAGVDASCFDGPEGVRRAYEEYQRRLRSLRLWDYDDLLFDAVRLLETDQETLDHCRQRFAHLLVDEFQDVNALQYRLVMLLAGKGDRLFVIGDPNQSIYGFRGADYRYFSLLREDFPETQLITLTTSYRSTPQVLHAASSVIARNPGRPKVSLEPSRHDGPAIRLVRPTSALAEGIAIVHLIGQMVGGATMLQAHGQRHGRTLGDTEQEQYGFGDIAVLFRTGRQAELLEECFLKEGIPYRVVGQKSFLERQSVRDLLAFFRFVQKPDDDFRLGQALKSPRYRPGSKALERIYARHGNGEQPLAQTLRAMVDRGDLEGTAAEKCRLLLGTAERFREQMAKQPADAVLRAWQEQTDTLADDDLNHLLRLSSRFASLTEMLEQLPLYLDGDYEQRERRTTTEAVSLMTLHAAKGLEFPVVFIAGVEDGLIPFGEGDTDAQEERRLFYVGMTRAKDQLVLSAAQSRTQRGRRAQYSLSPFVFDIPTQLIEEDKSGQPRAKRREAEQLKLL